MPVDDFADPVHNSYFSNKYSLYDDCHMDSTANLMPQPLPPFVNTFTSNPESPSSSSYSSCEGSNFDYQMQQDAPKDCNSGNVPLQINYKFDMLPEITTSTASINICNSSFVMTEAEEMDFVNELMINDGFNLIRTD